MYETTQRFKVTEARGLTGPTKFMEENGINLDLEFPFTRLKLNGIPENQDDWMPPLHSIHRNTPARCGLKIGAQVKVQELTDGHGEYRYYWNAAACRVCTEDCGLRNPPKANEKVVPFDPGCAGDP